MSDIQQLNDEMLLAFLNLYSRRERALESMEEASSYFLSSRLASDILLEFNFSQPLAEIAESMDLLLEYREMYVRRDVRQFLKELLSCVINRAEILAFFRPMFEQNLFAYQNVSELFDLKFLPLIFHQSTANGDAIQQFAAAVTLLKEHDVGVVLPFVAWTRVLMLEDAEREPFAIYLFLQLREICKYFYFLDRKQHDFEDLAHLSQQIKQLGAEKQELLNQEAVPEFSAATDVSSAVQNPPQSDQKQQQVNMKDFNAFLRTKLTAKDLLMGTNCTSIAAHNEAIRNSQPPFQQISPLQVQKNTDLQQRFHDYQINANSSSQHVNPFAADSSDPYSSTKNPYTETSDTSQTKNIMQMVAQINFKPDKQMQPQFIPPKPIIPKPIVNGNAFSNRPPLDQRLIEDDESNIKQQTHVDQQNIYQQNQKILQKSSVSFKKTIENEEISQVLGNEQVINEASDSQAYQFDRSQHNIQSTKLQDAGVSLKLTQTKDSNQFDQSLVLQPVNLDNIPNNFVVPQWPENEVKNQLRVQEPITQSGKQKFNLQAFISDNRELLQLGESLQLQNKQSKLEEMNNQFKLQQENDSEVDQDLVNKIIKKKKDRQLQEKLALNTNNQSNMDDLILLLESKAGKSQRIDEFNSYRMKVIKQELNIPDDYNEEFTSINQIINYYKNLKQKPSVADFVATQLLKSNNQSKQAREMFRQFYKVQTEDNLNSVSINPDYAIEETDDNQAAILLTNINGKDVNSLVKINSSADIISLINQKQRTIAQFNINNIANVIKAEESIKINLKDGTFIQMSCDTIDQAQHVHYLLKCQSIQV